MQLAPDLWLSVLLFVMLLDGVSVAARWLLRRAAAIYMPRTWLAGPWGALVGFAGLLSIPVVWFRVFAGGAALLARLRRAD